jgi:hypothetical protein
MMPRVTTPVMTPMSTPKHLVLGEATHISDTRKLTLSDWHCIWQAAGFHQVIIYHVTCPLPVTDGLAFVSDDCHYRHTCVGVVILAV